MEINRCKSEILSCCSICIFILIFYLYIPIMPTLLLTTRSTTFSHNNIFIRWYISTSTSLNTKKHVFHLHLFISLKQSIISLHQILSLKWGFHYQKFHDLKLCLKLNCKIITKWYFQNAAWSSPCLNVHKVPKSLHIFLNMSYLPSNL